MCQLLRTKTLASGSKHIKHQTLLPLFAIYLLSGCDLFKMPCLSQIFLMVSLDILCFNPFNLNKNRTYKNILWPIKNFENCFMAHQYMPKIFYDLHKNPPVTPPTYLI